MEDVIFWDLDGYQSVLDELRTGQGSCELFVKMIQERAEIEERYSRSLDSWRERWSDPTTTGREVEGTVTAWNTCLREAAVVAQIHRDCRNRIVGQSGPAENMTRWLKDHCRKRDANGMDLLQRMENEFATASDEFNKAYDRTLRVRDAYHKLSEDAQKARRFADEEGQEKFVNKSTKTRLFNRADKLTIQEKYVRRVYKRRIDTCQGEVKDRYKENMEKVLERCQGIETARLQCLKNQMLTSITMLDMTGSSSSLLDGSRKAYDDVVKTNPDMDVQEWVLRFNLNNFIELPSFDEYVTGKEEYELVQEIQKPQKRSGSIFEMSMFGSSSEEDSSDSESESSESSDSSSSSSSGGDESLPYTNVSSLSNVSRNDKQSASDKESANQARNQLHSNSNSTINAPQAIDQWDRPTESSAPGAPTQVNSGKLSVNQSTPNVSRAVADSSIVALNNNQSTEAHICKSTGFGFDISSASTDKISQAAAANVSYTNDSPSTTQHHDVMIHKVNDVPQLEDIAEEVASGDTGSSVEEEAASPDKLQEESRDKLEHPGNEKRSITVEKSEIWSSDEKSDEPSKRSDEKRHDSQSLGSVSEDSHTSCRGNGHITSERLNEANIEMNGVNQFHLSLNKKAQWSSVSPPVTRDTREHHHVIIEDNKVHGQADQKDLITRLQKIDTHTTKDVTDTITNHQDNIRPDQESTSLQGRSNNVITPLTVGTHHGEDHHHSNHVVCCQFGDDDISAGGRKGKAVKTLNKRLARWFIERYPEYEELEENMWSYLQTSNPARYQAARIDAKKLMLFVDSPSSNHTFKIDNVHLCNSLHMCNRHYDDKGHQCVCHVQSKLPPSEKKQDQDSTPRGKEDNETLKIQVFTRAEDKLCQEVISRLLRSHRSSLQEKNQHRFGGERDKCGLQHNSEHMCQIATGLILGKEIHEDKRLDSGRCNCRTRCHPCQEHQPDGTVQNDNEATESSDESDFSTDYCPTDDGKVMCQMSNSRPTFCVRDRYRSEKHARQTLKPENGEFLVRALYNFSPANWDELQLRMGEYLVQIGQDADDGWAVGRTTTKQGLFPASYVKFVKT